MGKPLITVKKGQSRSKLLVFFSDGLGLRYFSFFLTSLACARTKDLILLSVTLVPILLDNSQKFKKTIYIL